MSSQYLVSNVTYEPFGPANGYTLGNGQLVTRTFDQNGRLTDLVSPAFNEHVTRDVMGQISALGAGPGASPHVETYARDALGRLTGVLDPSSTAIESLTFNPTGDRLSKTGSGLFTGIYTYAPGTHQLTGTGTSARSGDLNGNTTAISRAGLMDGFGYDNRNRLTVAQATGGTVGTYGYNALGERIEKSSGSVTTQSDYDENHRLLSETDAAGTTSASTRDYIQMNGIPIALVDTQSGSSVVGYVTADQLGSPRAVSDSSGTIEWLWPLAGNAWGELSPVSSGLVLNERFPGQYYDQETGLSQNGFRDYDAGVGRYIQSDPMGLFGGQDSTYGYVDGIPLDGVPLDGVDRMGLQPFSPKDTGAGLAREWAKEKGKDIVKDKVKDELEARCNSHFKQNCSNLCRCIEIVDIAACGGPTNIVGTDKAAYRSGKCNEVCSTNSTGTFTEEDEKDWPNE